MKPYTWRSAILKSSLKPTTRHVLLTLSCYVNDVGQSAYPSTKTLAADTGLSERAVITHLHEASDAGWLKVRKHGFGGQNWSRNEYYPCTPAGFFDTEGAEACSAPSEKALNVATKGTERRSKGTEPNDKKALKDVQSNSPIELSKELSNKSNKKAAPPAPVLPDWLPKESWDEWVEYRASIKAPLNAKAVQLTIKKLAKFYAEGHDPVAVIDQSIFSGKWTDLYPIKGDSQAQPMKQRPPTAYQAKHDQQQALINRISGGNNAPRAFKDIN